MIDCALAGAHDFARDCRIQRRVEEGVLVLVVHHPDGGFRRFEVLSDGQALATADGADDAEIIVGERQIDVSVGTDRYRFPATSKAGDGQ